MDRRIWTQRVLPLALIVLAATRLIWVGDAPFVYDEPIFFQLALKANAEKTLPAVSPLMSTRGLHFGPLNIWIDQAFLAITHDIQTILVLRILAVGAVMVAVLLWLVRLFPTLNANLVLLPLLSPYFWHHGRDLWDNTLLIPLSALAFASYLSFCRAARPWKLFLAGLCLTFGFMLHLMVAPIIGAIGLHFLVRHRPYLRRHWVACAFFAAIYVLVSFPYLSYLFSQSHQPGGITGTRAGDARHLLSAFGLSWYGAQVFSFLGYGPDIPWWWRASGWGQPLSVFMVTILGLSAIVYPLSWYGLWLAVKQVVRSERGSERSLLSEGCWIAVVCFGLNLLMFCWGGVDFHPHYFHGVWIATFFFIWLAGSQRVAWLRPVLAAYALCMAVGLAANAWVAHRDGGFLKGRKYTVIRNFIDVAWELNRYPRETLFELPRGRAVSPASIDVLRDLVGGSEPKAELSPGRRLRVDFIRPEDPRDARLKVFVD